MATQTDLGAPLFLGVDFGTSSLKVACLDRAGVFWAAAKKPLLTQLSRDIYAEQDPQMWWIALCQATNEMLKANKGLRRRIAAIGVCATTSTVVACDSLLRPTAPAIMWLDGRAVEEARALGLYQHRRQEGPVSPQHMVAKALWLSRHSPELLEGLLVEAATWLTHKLTGRLVVPTTIPPFTWGISPERWSELGPLADELLSHTSTVLINLVGPTEALGTLTQKAAEQTGLRQSTIVCSAGNDGLLAAVGAGLHIDGSVIEVGGTGYTTWSRSLPCTGGPTAGPSAAIPDPFSPQAIVAVTDLGEAGLFIRWLRELLLMDQQAFDTLCQSLTREALSGIYTASGVRVNMMLFQSNRTEPAGASLGALRASTTGSDLVQATLESLATSAAETALRHGADGLSGRHVILVGGISRNPLYRLLRSSIDNRQEIYITAKSDTGVVGAAMCAACAADEYPSIWSACSEMAPARRKLKRSSVVTSYFGRNLC